MPKQRHARHVSNGSRDARFTHADQENHQVAIFTLTCESYPGPESATKTLQLLGYMPFLYKSERIFYGKVVLN